MRVILNGDDFGWSADTVEATIELLERGVLSSATIMPRMPSTGAAIEFARKTPKCSFGVHLTFSDNGLRPLTEPDRLSTLTAADGAFRDSNAIRRDALLGRLSVAQIAVEMEAQVRSVGNRGVAVSHVDSHGHLHKFSPFRKALRDVLPRVGISRVRNVQDIYLNKAQALRSPTFWLGRLWRRKIMLSYVTTDHFFMPASAWDTGRWAHSLLDHVSDNSVLEVGVHPGKSEAWRREDYQAVVVFAERVKDAGHRVVNWNDL